MDVQALWTEINRWGLFFGCYEHIGTMRLYAKADRAVLLRVPVLRNDAYVDKRLPYPLPKAIIMVAPLFFANERYAIYVNSRFMRLFTAAERLAGYMHEMGHLHCGHLEDSDEELDDEETLARELAADAFACRRGHASALRSALAKCMTLVKRHVPRSEQEGWLEPLASRLRAAGVCGPVR